jgi:hypothetical protein
MDYKVDLTVTIMRDTIPNEALCHLCFEKIMDNLSCEILVESPIRNSMKFHANCYEQLFIGMLQLADKLRNAEMN